jgi:hypothetical protein
MRVKLTKIEAGVYATADRRFQVERVGSVGEWDTYTDCWIVAEYTDEDAADDFNGDELFEAGTKRECVEWLNGHLAC